MEVVHKAQRILRLTTIEAGEIIRKALLTQDAVPGAPEVQATHEEVAGLMATETILVGAIHLAVHGPTEIAMAPAVPSIFRVVVLAVAEVLAVVHAVQVVVADIHAEAETTK